MTFARKTTLRVTGRSPSGELKNNLTFCASYPARECTISHGGNEGREEWRGGWDPGVLPHL